jgi:RimJ/RimL family protein N-acetyltransferase/SAM-dependent methyltransferase
LEPWHAEQFAAAVAGARDHLAPWIPFAHTVTDVATARDLLQRMANSHANDSRHMYGIWQDGTLVGGALFPVFDTANGMCEIGVWLVPEAQGRGLITRASRYLIDWAIAERGMQRVSWHTDPRNERSRAVARRLGMTFEGVRRSSHVVAGARQDGEVWSILASEWRAAAGALDPDGDVPFFDATYANFTTDVQAAVRRDAFGEDIGQNGWLTADEWRGYLAWLALGPHSELLDIASGSGGPAALAAAETGCRVTGVDNHVTAVEVATKVASERGLADRMRFVQADASRPLPFADASFDAVTCIDAIHHFPDRHRVLAEWRRVLRPGGHLVFTNPIIVTGMLTNREIARRSSIGFFIFTPAGTDERLLASAGFTLTGLQDATENMAVVADRWHASRALHCDELTRIEGVDTFDGQQRFLRTTSDLATQRTLSRYVFRASTDAR